MKNILNIIKKEFSRFFKDTRMVITTLILPGLMIYVLYSLMGGGLTTSMKPSEGYTYKVYIFNESQTLRPALEKIEETYLQAGVEIKVSYAVDSKEVSIETAKQQIIDKTVDLIILYPENFDTELQKSLNSQDNINVPNVELFYNSTSTTSSACYDYFTNYFNIIEQTLSNVFDMNAEPNTTYNLATEKDVSAQIFSLMLPMLLIMFLFSGCISIAPESIAGEKERGTIATLLVTPIKRRDLAIGKIVSLSVISLLSGISSFLGTMLSLPKMMGDDMALSTNVYGFYEYSLLLLIILSSVLLFTALIGIVSAYAKSVKEASSLMTPMLIVVTLLGMSSMFSGGAVNGSLWYLIPIYNCVQSMTAIFAFQINITNIILTIVSNIVYSCVLVFVLSKMFNSEKIMFNK